MKILVSGSTGLVGSALVPALTAQGHHVVRLTRGRAAADGRAIAWSPEDGILDPAALDGFDAVIHLAGESIASGRWTAEKKRRIRDSRVRGTSLLAGAVARLAKPPAVLLCASAIGYYGDRDDETLTEDSPSGTDFLSSVCRDWEDASRPAEAQGVRVVRHRFGIILSRNGGALAKMLPPFRLGAGGRLGDGRQWMSWIALDDVVGVLQAALTLRDLRGAVNTVAPRPVTNADFTRSLARVLHRPAFFPMPAAAARLVFGEMADALLLSSQRVEPRRLLTSGHRFRLPDLEPALAHLLGHS